MRIALRPSGGRGDYELAGTYNAIHASDLFERRQLFQISPSLSIDGKAAAHRLAGKPRIRPDGGRHAYVFIAALLLLPKPRRELSATPDTLPQIKASEYTIGGIDVDVLSQSPATVTFAPTAIWVRSRGGFLKIDFAERMAMVTALWGVANETSMPIAALVKAHWKSAESGDHDQIVRSAASIQKHFGVDGDVLPLLLREAGLTEAFDAAITGLPKLPQEFESEDEETLPEESRRLRVRKWRKQADRGPGAREFSLRVREAYDFRCFFSGERFPKLSVLDSAGVDGAHILPWSVHQLNAVSNGLCLCKQCHWGFDNGLLHLDFDRTANAYLLSIPKDVEAAALGEKFDLKHFQAKTGKIDSSRLPKNPALWPSPKYLEELNRGV